VAGASAAILMRISKERDGTSLLLLPIGTYLPEGALADTPIRKDATALDADGLIRFKTVLKHHYDAAVARLVGKRPVEPRRDRGCKCLCGY